MVELAQKRQRFDVLRREIERMVADREAISRPRKVRVQLEALHDASWDQDWQRCYLLLCCYCRLKSGRTHGRLRLLRASMHAEGKSEAFDAFMDQLNEVLFPQSITPHGYTTTFSKMDSGEILQSLGDTLKPLEAFGRPFFMHSGALLGYIRDGRLIDHDDDVDVGIYLGNLSQADVAHEWLKFKQALADADLLDPKTLDHDQPMFKFHSDLGIDIDLFPAWSENGKFSIYPNSFYEMDDSDVFPFQSFGQDPLGLPAHPEVLLKLSYGEGWKTPDPLFGLNWARKKKQFSKLFDVSYALPVATDD